MSTDTREPVDENGHGDGNGMPRDDALRALYRQLPPEEPRAEVDEAIRAAARKAIGAGPRATGAAPVAYRRTLRWAVPLATAASLVLVVMMVREEHPERAGVPLAVQESVVMEQERVAPASAVAPEPGMAPLRDTAPQAAVVAGTAAREERAVARKAEDGVPPARIVAGDAMSITAAGAGSEESAGGGYAVPQAAATAERDAFAAGGIVAEDRAVQQPAREEMAMSSVEAPQNAAKATVSARAMQAPAPAAAPAPLSATAEGRGSEADLPFATTPGARITAGPLSGFTLLARSGGEAGGRAVFRVSGDEGVASAWLEQVASRFAAAGWRERADCAPRTFVSGSARVTLTATPGTLVLSWFAEGECR